MSIHIPEQLHNVNFRFIKVKAKEKIPIEKEWQTKNNYVYSQVELSKWLMDGNNYGVACGFGGLIVVDSDTEELNRAMGKLPKTFVVKTGNPDLNHRHHYFICNDCDGKVVIQKQGKHYGEIQSKGSQVVAPGSTHPNGRLYLIYDQNGIAEISFSQLKEAIKDLVSPDRFEQKVTIPVSDVKNKSIPGDVKKLIKDGCEVGQRNFNTWVIVKTLSNLGYDTEIILEKALEFNSNCQEPRDIEEVRKHVEQLLRRPQYLAEKISYEQLQKLLEEDILKNEGIEIKEEDAFKVYNGEDFMRLDIPEPDFQIQGYVIEKAITILGGYQSVFKTHTAVYIALCVSNGVKLFGRFDCKKGNVWYVNEELHAGSFQKLLERLSSGNNLEIGKNFYVSSFQSLKIDTQEDNKKYMDFIKEKKINLVIFDTFRECFVSQENSADEINLVLHQFIRPIIEATGCGFLIIMHKGKATADNRQAADLLRGSSVFRNYVDSIILIDRVRKSERVELIHEKIRGTKEQNPLNVTWQFGDNSIRPLVMTEEELERALIDDCKKEIVIYLDKEEEEEFETKAKSKIREKFVDSKKYSSATFYRSLKELREEGKIRQIKRGIYRYGGEGKIDEY